MWLVLAAAVLLWAAPMAGHASAQPEDSNCVSLYDSTITTDTVPVSGQSGAIDGQCPSGFFLNATDPFVPKVDGKDFWGYGIGKMLDNVGNVLALVVLAWCVFKTLSEMIFSRQRSEGGVAEFLKSLLPALFGALLAWQLIIVVNVMVWLLRPVGALFETVWKAI